MELKAFLCRIYSFIFEFILERNYGGLEAIQPEITLLTLLYGNLNAKGTSNDFNAGYYVNG